MENLEEKVEKIMAVLEQEGAPPMGKEAYRDLLQRVIAECHFRLDCILIEIAQELEE